MVKDQVPCHTPFRFSPNFMSYVLYSFYNCKSHFIASLLAALSFIVPLDELF